MTPSTPGTDPLPPTALRQALDLLAKQHFDAAQACMDAHADACPDVANRTRAELIRGMLLLLRSEFEAGLLLTVPALNTLEALGQTEGCALGYGYTGYGFACGGDPERGLDFVERGFALPDAQALPAEHARLLNIRGVLLSLAGHLDRSNHTLLQALALLPKAGRGAAPFAFFMANLALNRNHRAELALQQGTALPQVRQAARQALRLAQRGLDALTHSTDPRGRQRCLIELARANALLGHFELAQQQLDLLGTEELEGPVQLARLRVQLRLQRMLGQFGPARQTLAQALDCGRERGLPIQLLQVYQDAVQLETEAGCWAEALQWSDRHAQFMEENCRRRLRMVVSHADAFIEAGRARSLARREAARVADLSQARQRLVEGERHWQDLALRDALTGLYNRGGFHERAQALWAGVAPLALAIVDADHFKRVNDSFGHAIGDAVLRQLAQLLLQACRPDDLVARLGGEEFVLLLNDANTAQAAQVCERVRAQVAGHDWAALHPGLAITVSLGLAERSPADDCAALLERADQALYAAKSQGRNRCVQAPPRATAAPA